MTRPLWAERAHGGVVEYDDRCVPGTTTVGLPGEIREALLNLVQNALDAMPDGGTLSVETGCLDADVWVQVSDTGIGMTEDVRDRAFEPFFTTKGSGGSGLGLSEVYGIMKRHRGRAEIHSTLGFGTTVRLVFPIAAAVASPPAPSVVGVRAARRVLVVEDNDEGREFLAALLVSDGHSVDAVSSVHEARERLMLEMVRETSPRPVQSRAQSSEQEIEQSQHTPEDEASTQAPHPAPYDVLLTDVGLPDGSGWELVELVRERWPDMRVGVVTGWEPNTSMASAADFTLRKPLRAEQLLALVAAER
jgi:CheY-like chemotaxis protein